MDPTSAPQTDSTEVDLKSQAQPKPARRKKPPYRKEKWKSYERVSILQGSSLDFISTTETPDNEKHARRLVRSEVMKNYHAKRRDALKESHINFNVEKSSVNRWRGDPFVKFPVDLSFAVKEFLDLVFTDTRMSIVFYREAQLPNGLLCAGSFHQVLANISIWMRAPGCPKELEPYLRKQEQQNHAIAMKHVQGQVVSKEGSKSEGLVAAVCNLLTYSHMNDDRAGVNIHMNALEKIIGLRGGLSTLIPSLQIYIFWFDTQIAAIWDTRPRFPPPTHFTIHSSSTWCLPPGAEELSKVLRCSYPSLKRLMDIFDDIIKYSLYIENEVFRRGAPVLKDFINGYFLLWYDLLSFQSSSNSDSEDTDFVILESIRLSLLLFAAPVRRFLSISTYSTAEQLKKLRHIILLNAVEREGPLWRLRVWMASMGFSEAVKEEDVLWWAGLWVETLWKAGGSDSRKEIGLEDFDWKDGFTFFKQRSLTAQDERGEDEKKTMEDEAEGSSIATTVSSVLWLGKLQGERYREVCDRVHEILKSREPVPDSKILVECPASRFRSPD